MSSKLSGLSIRILLLLFVILLLIGCAKSDTAWYAYSENVHDMHCRFEYDKMKVTSQYIEMRDGVKIAVDIYLPEGLEADKKIPTILMQTRYVRAMEFKPPFNKILKGRYDDTIEYFIKHGYAWVYVDARGSGASFGTRPHPYSKDEVLDGAEVTDWIVKQPWSNGKVGVWGNSYDGGTLLYLLTNHHPAIKAAMPRYAMFDSYSEVVFPGGIHLVWLTDIWSRLAKALDKNAVWEFAGKGTKIAVVGTKPVDEDKNRAMLRQAVKEHESNGDISQLAEGITYRDDASSMDQNVKVDNISPAMEIDKINTSNTPMYFYTGWFDSSFVMSEIHLFMNSKAKDKKLTIGPWDHGGWTNVSPYANKKTPLFDSNCESRRFFDFYLKDVPNSISQEKPVHYFTMGQEQWKAADKWPPAGIKMTDYYFAEGNQLSTEKPNSASGFDNYDVTYDTGTGDRSRWVSLVNLKHKTIKYGNRKSEDKKLLVYDSPELSEDVEVTGHPVVHLQVSSTAEDGNFFVYLEDVDQWGRVQYVTEGMLRAIHRKVSNDKAPYLTPIPYRTFKREDGQPLVENEVAELVFALYPTSYQFQKGHRIRISIAGADKDHFVNNPDQEPSIKVYRNNVRASKIELPIMKQDTE